MTPEQQAFIDSCFQIVSLFLGGCSACAFVAAVNFWRGPK